MNNEVWLVEYSTYDYHEIVVACATEDIAKREKQQLIDSKFPYRNAEDYDIFSYKVVTE
jgi:hypothetical protein